MAEGDVAQGPDPISPAASGGGAGVPLGDRYVVYPAKPLPELNSPNALAYAVDDRRGGGRPAFALAMAPDLPVRFRTLLAMKGQQFNCVLSILGYDFVFWPPMQRQTLVVVFERPFGGRLVENLTDTFVPMADSDYQKIVLKPLVQGLEELRGRSVVHRAIRPNNLFFMDAERTRVVIGECISAPPAYDQPVLCEPIESALAMPEGRTTGTYADDMYALGVSLLYALIGRRPGGGLRNSDLLHAKIAMGSYAALAGDARFSLAMIEVLRGLLIDDPLARWDVDAMNLWIAGRRLSPILAKPEKRAQRTFRFAGKEILTRRDLAIALVENWDQAAAVITDGQVEVWLRRALDEKNLAEAVANQVRLMTGPAATGGGGGSDALVARVCMLLDPQAPIRYKTVRFHPEGLGTAFATASMRQKDVRTIAECVLREIPDAWFEAQTEYDPNFSLLQTRVKEIRGFLRMAQPGYGLERCLYDLNPDLPCQSPLIVSDYVMDIDDVLPALDAAAKRVDAKSWPADRHIIAFIAARFNFDVEKQINALNSPQADTSALGLLSLLAVLQWKLGPETLFGLSGWIGGLVGPVIASYHNREVRRKLEKEIPKLVRKGSLPDLYNALDDVEERQKDLDGFAWAKAEYAGAEQEILDLENDTATREAQAQKIGQQTAAVMSVLIGLITISVLCAMQMW